MNINILEKKDVKNIECKAQFLFEGYIPKGTSFCIEDVLKGTNLSLKGVEKFDIEKLYCDGCLQYKHEIQFVGNKEKIKLLITFEIERDAENV